ncbi:MAG: hypothetical protein R2684_04660 [Pyrinomonadaceae bacterium]
MIRRTFPFLLVFLVFVANAAGADQWITVDTTNFRLVSNANESAARQQGFKLEQFRLVFSSLFPGAELRSTNEVNVIVFKDRRSYSPFLPRKSSGQSDTNVAGYFIGGEDAAYITFSVPENENDSPGTAYHEYVHYLLDNNFDDTQIPKWFGEGLAEYFSTFQIVGNDAQIGNLDNQALYLLNNTEFIPWEQFFDVGKKFKLDGDQSLFYSQAWALVHFYGVSNDLPKLTKFIELSNSGKDYNSAAVEALGMDIKALDKTLRKYVKQKKFKRQLARLKAGWNVDESAKTSVISEAESKAYLGDLMVRMQEYLDAEGYLATALQLEPNNPRANTSMGLLRWRQDNFSEAKKYLEKAVSFKEASYYSHYMYAYVLVRSKSGAQNVLFGIEDQYADQILSSAKRSIELNPKFAPAYDILGYVYLVRGDDIDTGLKYVLAGLKASPGNDSLLLTYAQLLFRKEKFEDADKIARRVSERTQNAATKARAISILNSGKQRSDYLASRKSKERINAGDLRGTFDSTRGKPLTAAEKEAIDREKRISWMNRELTPLADGHRRLLGNLDQVACKGNNITYGFSIRDGAKETYTSVGFQDLELIAFTDTTDDKMINCGVKFSNFLAVVTVAPATVRGTNGVLTSVVFVPDDFRFKSEDEIKRDSTYVQMVTNGVETYVAIDAEGDETTEETAKRLFDESVKARDREVIGVPGEGETMIEGHIDRILCDSSGMNFHIDVGGKTLVLRPATGNAFSIVSLNVTFNPAALACNATPPSEKVIVIYTNSGGRIGLDGTMRRMAFVLEDFKMKQ